MRICAVQVISVVAAVCCVAAEPPSTPETVAQLQQLVDSTRRIEHSINAVTDRAGADAAAKEIRQHLQQMNMILHRLAQNPPADPEETRLLGGYMGDVVRTTQNFIPAVQKLSEVNAYGSAELLSVLSELMPPSGVTEDEATLPHRRLYDELSDGIEDLLYLLRRVQDTESARRSVGAVDALMQQLCERYRDLATLPTVLTQEQRRSTMPARARLRRLRSDVDKEVERLGRSAWFSVPELRRALQR